MGWVRAEDAVRDSNSKSKIFMSKMNKEFGGSEQKKVKRYFESKGGVK